MINSGTNAALGTNVTVANIFGGTVPSTLSFDTTTKRYNLESAVVMRFAYLIYDEEPLSAYVRQGISDFLK